MMFVSFYQLISRLETFIRQIKYVSSDIKNRMNQIEILSMLTLCEDDSISNEIHSAVNGKLNAIHLDDATIDDDKQLQYCLDVTEHERQAKSVTFSCDAHHIPSIATYFSIIHDNQHRKMKNVENLFSTVGPILIKLESLVLDTNTGELDNMHLYYNFWENQLLELLIRYF